MTRCFRLRASTLISRSKYRSAFELLVQKSVKAKQDFVKVRKYIINLIMNQKTAKN